MAQTSWGFDGTITELQWSTMAGLLGNGYVAKGSTDCVVTAVPGARSVSVAAGSLYGDGVVTVLDAAETVAMTTPVNGQWYVIALRRTWATNTTALVAIAGATTTTTTPTAAPSSFPTLNTQPGVLTDQPIAWAWCNSANTTVVVFDIRLQPVKSLPPVVATAAERDAKFMAPTQGLQVWRNDLGAVETYYGLYNVSTNPGGRDSAGWYVDTRQTGLRPIQPTLVTIATGSGSANALGQVTFTGATTVSLENVFSSAYRNYRVILNVPASSAQTNVLIRFRSAGTDNSNNSYYQYWTLKRISGTIQDNSGGPGTSFALFAKNNANTYGTWTGDIMSPNVTSQVTTATGIGHGGDSTNSYNVFNTVLFDATTSFDGISFISSAGTITGTVSVLGYND